MRRSRLWRATMCVLMVLAVTGLAALAQEGQQEAQQVGQPGGQQVGQHGRSAGGPAAGAAAGRPTASWVGAGHTPTAAQ